MSGICSLIIGRQQFKHRVIRRNSGEGFERGTGANGKKPLNGQLIPIQIFPQNFRFFAVVYRPKSERFPPASFPKPYLAGRASIPSPLSFTSRADNESLAVAIEDIHRCGVDASTLPTLDFKQVIVRKPDAPSHEHTKQAIDPACNKAWLKKVRARIAHTSFTLTPNRNRLHGYRSPSELDPHNRYDGHPQGPSSGSEV